MYVTPVLQWTRRYCPSGAFLVFYRYFPLMKALHVDWLPRRHQFSSITYPAAASRMVSTTCITLDFCVLCENASLISSVIGSVCNNYCDEVWQHMSPWDGSSSHSLVKTPIMRLHDSSLTLTKVVLSTPSGCLLPDYACFVFLNTSSSSLSFVYVDH